MSLIEPLASKIERLMSNALEALDNARGDRRSINLNVSSRICRAYDCLMAVPEDKRDRAWEEANRSYLFYACRIQVKRKLFLDSNLKPLYFEKWEMMQVENLSSV